jgi:hypothetical protein
MKIHCRTCDALCGTLKKRQKKPAYFFVRSAPHDPSFYDTLALCQEHSDVAQMSLRHDYCEATEEEYIVALVMRS